MRHSFYAGAMLCIVALLTGCSEEEQFASGNNLGEITLTANSGSDTRTTLDDSNNVLWAEGDQIYVFSEDYKTYGTLTLTNGAGYASGTFKGSLVGDGTIGYGIHPVPGKTGDGNLAINFPAEYTYPENSNNSPMWGKVSSSDNNYAIDFNHLCGMMRITIKNMPKEAGTLTLTGKGITGNATIKKDGTSGNLSLEAPAQGNEQTITISFDGDEGRSSMVFNIPLPAATYQEGIGIKAMINGTEVVAENQTKTEFKIEAGKITIMPTLTYTTVSGGTPQFLAEAENTEEAAELLKTNDAVSIKKTDTGSGDATFTIPKKENETATTTATTTCSFSEVTGSNTLTIKTEEGFTAPINLQFGKVEETAEISTPISVEAPHAEIASNGWAVTLKTLTASTDENTLVIKDDVTIEALTVQKGNVRVEKGGKISSITYGGGSTIYLIVEEGAEVPGSIPTGITKISAKDYDFDKLSKAAAASGGTYTLASNMIFTKPLEVTGTMTLDLNGYKITAEGTLTKSAANRGSDALIIVRRGGNLTINDTKGGGEIYSGSYNDTKILAVVKLTDKDEATSGNKAILTMNGGTIRSCYYAICGNGTRHDTEVTINGGTIEGGLITNDGPAVYHPQDGKFTMANGTIRGYSAGIEMRSGTLEVKGGNIISTSKTFSATPNGNGATIEGAAVAVSQHTTDKAINVTLSGGTLTGLYALYEADLQNSTHTNISINISGNCTFNGKIYSENCEGFIGAGTFSDPSVLKYMAAGANVNIKLLANISIDKPELAKGYTLDAANATANLDLNGKDIVNTTETTDATPFTQIFTVANGTLNISGNGNVTCDASTTTKDDGYRMAVEAKGQGVVNIHGGSYYNTQKKNTQIDLIYAQGNGKINIYGGTFESGKYGTPDNDTDGRYWVLNLRNANKTTAGITVYGGTFINFNPANPNMDDNASYLATGYEVIRDNQVYAEAHKVADGKKTYIVREITE